MRRMTPNLNLPPNSLSTWGRKEDGVVGISRHQRAFCVPHHFSRTKPDRSGLVTRCAENVVRIARVFSRLEELKLAAVFFFWSVPSFACVCLIVFYDVVVSFRTDRFAIDAQRIPLSPKVSDSHAHYHMQQPRTSYRGHH